MSNITALKTYLAPFESFFAEEGVSEVCINRPFEIWVEKNGEFTNYSVPLLSSGYLMQLAILVAEYNQREISPEYPSLSGVLPDGSRVHFVIEPACEKGSFVCCIRRQSVRDLPLQDYFDVPKNFQQSQVQNEKKLITLYRQDLYVDFLKLAVLMKKNIIISGGTSTGKTSLLNSMLKCIPLSERLLTIETDREVRSAHRNAVHLLAAEEGQSLSSATMLGLLKAALRLRPDRILVSELRAEEAFPYLRAVNSGHPGSITTLHADSVDGCFEQLALMTMQSHSHFKQADILRYAKAVIPIVIQIKRDDRTAKRFVSEVYYHTANSLIKPTTLVDLFKVRTDLPGVLEGTDPGTPSALFEN